MRKIFTIILSLFLALNVSASILVDMHYTGTTTTNMVIGDNNAEVLNLDADTFYVDAYKNGNTSAPGLNKNGDFRLYAGNVKDAATIGEGSIIKVFFNDGIDAEFDSIEVTFVSNYDEGLDITLTSDTLILKNVNTVNKQVRIENVLIWYSLPEPVPTSVFTTDYKDSGIIYNILGIPVDESYHGIVIKNHKKVIQ